MTWQKQIAHFQWLVGRDTDEQHAEYLAMKHASHEAGAWNAIYNIVADALCGFIGFGPAYSRRTVGPIHAFVENAVPAFLKRLKGMVHYRRCHLNSWIRRISSNSSAIPFRAKHLHQWLHYCRESTRAGIIQSLFHGIGNVALWHLHWGKSPCGAALPV